MKNFRVVIKVESDTKDFFLDSITIDADSPIHAYNLACNVLTLFSDNFDYTIVEIKEI